MPKQGDIVIKAATDSLRRLCLTAGIDESHGVEHALTVLRHTERALDAAGDRTIAPARALSVRLAALLHDADDRKYFPETCTTYANAVRIMEEAGVPDQGNSVLSDAIEMIKLVSCSANGNSAPPQTRDCPEMLWPRWADRLEATGEIGVWRCYQYNLKDGAPLAVDTTPRPATVEEAFDLATEDRFARYQSSGGQSASMMDHYYDKLLQVARPHPDLVQNTYLETEALQRTEPLLSICMAYTESGMEGAQARIDEIGMRLEAA